MVALAGLFSGCASSTWFSSSTDKINAAFPVTAEVQEYKAAALLLANNRQKKVIEAQLDERLTQRARRCAKDYAPSLHTSAEEIRKYLNNPSCFAEADQEIIAWLSIRKTGLILAQPPLTPVPTEPTIGIKADDGTILGSPLFAANAGIALVTTSSTIALMDINTRKVLFRERKAGAAGPLSPNGRLFLTLETGNRLQIRDSVTGSAVSEIHGVLPWEFHWLDDRTAFYANRKYQSFFVDFASGETIPTGVKNLVISKTVRMPDVSDQYAVLTGNKVLIFGLTRDNPVPELKLLNDRTIHMAGLASNTSGTTPDGKYFFGIQSRLTLLNLLTLESEEISLEPFNIQTGISTPDPDKILLTGFITPHNGIKSQDYLYSISNRTLATIKPETAGLQRRVHIAPLNRMAMIENDKLSLIDELQISTPIPLPEFIRNAVVISEQHKIANDRNILAQKSACLPSGEENPDGTELHAIGIYEGPIHRGKDPSANKVNVKVYKTGQPIVLALLSYEPVVWNIQLDKGANVREIILSGPQSTQVSGINKKSTKVSRQNFGYAYEDCTFFRTAAPKIKAFSGLDTTSFQGEYRGTGFPVRSQKQPAPPVAGTNSRALKSPPGLDEGLAAFEKGDHRTALDRLTPLAAKGNAMAQNTLGKMHMQGLGVPRDSNKALLLFRQAAKKKLPNAQNNLGVMYAGGYGVQQDFRQAISWFRKAANQGYAVAINNLAEIYGQGVIVNKDPIEAERWRHASRGSPLEKSNEIVNIQFAGNEDYEKAQNFYYGGRFREALPLFLAAAQQGHPEAQLKLASLYRHGQGVKKDGQQARYWQNKAAAQSYSDEDGRDRIYLINSGSEEEKRIPRASALVGKSVPLPAGGCACPPGIPPDRCCGLPNSQPAPDK